MGLRRFAAGLSMLLAATHMHGQTPTIALIPMPREIHVLPDQALPTGVRVACGGCEAEDQFTAADLTEALQARRIATNGAAPFTIQLARNAKDFTEAQRAEGYRIGLEGLTLTVSGATAAGVFYGAQTVKQMIEGSGTRAVLHAATILDWPAMKVRGLHDDLSRGPIPTVAFQKHLIQELAAYKINLYSPYFEETQQYAGNPLPAVPGGAMTAGEARELSAFAARYHVSVVPEQEAFGHLRHVLQYEQYNALAETPHGAVLAPGQAGSLALIQSWFTELAQDYPGSPYLHLGADETIELGVGQTKEDVDARGRATVYLDFMQRIVTALEPLHRRLLFWGDVAQDAPAQLKAMPRSFKDATIAVAWGYLPNPAGGFAKIIHPFTDAGFETWVAPSLNNYRQVYPNYNLGLPDIQQFTGDGQKFGATGQLNTLWNDDGETLADQNWYGILFGAGAAWQAGEASIPEFQASFGRVFHGDRTGKIDAAQREMMAAMDMLTQAKVISATEGSDGLFWVDPWSADGQRFAAKMRSLNAALRLHAERAITLVAEARAASAGLSEPNALDALEFGARRVDFLGLKFQLADEMAAGYQRAFTAATATDPKIHRTVSRELSDINGVNGRLQDLVQIYSLLRDLYAQTWLRTNRPHALTPVLERYDFTIQLWIARIDRVRSAQRQYAEAKTLPPAGDLGIPPPTF